MRQQRGTPNITNGTHVQIVDRSATRTPKNQALFKDVDKNWPGAYEYKVNVPGRSDKYRILKQEIGTDAIGQPIYRYGYTRKHYEGKNHLFILKVE